MRRTTFLGPRTIAAALAVGRAAIGAGLLAAPAAAARAWVGDDIDTRGARVFARATGGRDLALAAGTLAALRGRSDARLWVQASILADGADIVATALIRPHGTTAGIAGLYALAGGAVVLSAAVAPRLD